MPGQEHCPKNCPGNPVISERGGSTLLHGLPLCLSNTNEKGSGTVGSPWSC
jgi:hypothetical protein